MFLGDERPTGMTNTRTDESTPATAAADRRTRPTVLLLAAAALVPLAGCGDDPTEAAGATTEYCDAAVALDQAFQAVDADDPEHFEDTLAAADAALREAARLAPAAARAEYAVLETALGEVVATGNPEAYFADDVVTTEAAVHARDLEQCDWTAVAVAAEDYAFAADWPTASGPVSFDVTNTGAEPHVLIVARKLDGVAGPALAAFQAAPTEEELARSFEFAASVFVAPGTSDHALAELPAGEYVVFCPVPVGTAGEASIGDGPPHHAEGMLAAFSLT